MTADRLFAFEDPPRSSEQLHDIIVSANTSKAILIAGMCVVLNMLCEHYRDRDRLGRIEAELTRRLENMNAVGIAAISGKAVDLAKAELHYIFEYVRATHFENCQEDRDLAMQDGPSFIWHSGTPGIWADCSPIDLKEMGK